MFYISTIITGVTFVMCLFIKESRPSLLLERKVAALRTSTSHASFRTRNPDAAPDFRTFIQVFLVRPLHRLFTQPIIIMISIMGSVVCATFWLFVEALLIVYGSFGFSERHASLAFIPIGIGLFFGIFTRLYDQRTYLNVVAKARHSSLKINFSASLSPHRLWPSLSGSSHGPFLHTDNTSIGLCRCWR